MRVWIAIIMSGLLLQGCGPMGAAVGAGAAVGSASAREGGIGQTWTDTKIHASITDAYFKHSVDLHKAVSITVREGRVLLTGIVQTPELRVDAVRLAWQVNGVRQVINEIRVQDSEGISGFARDSWISTQLRSKLIFDKGVDSINYTFESVGAVVYLMGVARDQEELDLVINHARSISYVKEVVSYVRLRSDPRPNESIGNTPSN